MKVQPYHANKFRVQWIEEKREINVKLRTLEWKLEFEREILENIILYLENIIFLQVLIYTSVFLFASKKDEASYPFIRRGYEQQMHDETISFSFRYFSPSLGKSWVFPRLGKLKCVEFTDSVVMRFSQQTRSSAPPSRFSLPTGVRNDLSTRTET